MKPKLLYKPKIMAYIYQIGLNRVNIVLSFALEWMEESRYALIPVLGALDKRS